MTQIIPIELITEKIYYIRGHKVMLSPDLASLYGVETRALVQAVKRNIERFPIDFMFQLSEQEFENLKSQNVISSWGGARRARPYAFTEHGAVMIASLLNSLIAVKASIQVVRAFVGLRTMLATHKDLSHKLNALEQKYDAQFKVIFDAIRELMNPEPPPPERQIGFK